MGAPPSLGRTSVSAYQGLGPPCLHVFRSDVTQCPSRRGRIPAMLRWDPAMRARNRWRDSASVARAATGPDSAGSRMLAHGFASPCCLSSLPSAKAPQAGASAPRGGTAHAAAPSARLLAAPQQLMARSHRVVLRHFQAHRLGQHRLWHAAGDRDRPAVGFQQLNQNPTPYRAGET
jgi:hypothetical protein